MNREDCLRLDAADPLAPLRAEFTVPDGLYLDGNSLGVLPRRTPAKIADLVERQWGEGLIASWNTEGWFERSQSLGDRVAPLIGAGPGEVVVCDSTSVNLFKTLAAALRLRPGRRVIVVERDTFPTDLYIAEGVAGLFPGVRMRELADGIDEDVAVVLLSHTDYRTGAVHDMKAVTQEAHRHGALALWDLCHSAGALPVDLTGAEADFAVGCTYKYLNAGPGAPAFLYAAARHHEAADQPLTGWFGHSRPFDFVPGYAPAQGITRFLAGTPALVAMAAVDAGLEIFESVDLAEVRAKSLAMTDLFIELTAGLPGVELVTPVPHERRGSQVSLRHPDAHAIVQALIARGVVGDFRAPDVMRFGFTPLYLRHVDVFDAAEALSEVIRDGAHRDPRFSARGKVT
ncbi:kynureninase [Actinocorallia longicatena]|uniref:Kynureninase n=1 Tax=Actinocorallia longicatena TaxID=111803 RepID=A0ABP6Q7A7_9ACTN